MNQSLPLQNPASFACTVTGMCCASEAGPIERAVRAIPGVQQADANPALARLTVAYDPQTVTPDLIVARVEQIGFKVETGLGGHRDSAHAHHHDLHPLERLGSFLRAHLRELPAALCALLFAAAWLSEAAGYVSAAPVLYIVATVVGVLPIARSGWQTMRGSGTLDINVLMTIAAIGALVIGEYAEGAAVVFLFALGNLLESYTMGRARNAIRAVMQLAPEVALVLRDGHERQVPARDVAVGETIVVRPGDRVALDGVVVGGQSSVNQAPITGESIPVVKSEGAEVFAGSINGEGSLEMHVTRPASDSTIARIIHLVGEAQANKAPTQRIIDRFAQYYTPAVLVLAVLVATIPPLITGEDWSVWWYRALVMLVVACPCALVISTPVSIVSAINAAARAGVLFKGGAALEAIGALRAMAFDKTGTLTEGKPVITEVVVASGLANDAAHPESLLLGLAAAVERRSAHPLAQAVVAEAEARGVPAPQVTEFQSVSGRGAQGVVEGRAVVVGNRAMLQGMELDSSLEAALDRVEGSGQTPILVGYDGAVRGLIAIADKERAESGATLGKLRQLGIHHITMLTGDTAHAAARVAARVGIQDTRAALLPNQKLAALDELITRYNNVGMVGDGVNDAPALARATVGIAMGAAGSDAALETADVALMSNGLSQLPFAVQISRRTRTIIIQNFVFALVIKALFVIASLTGVATLWMAVFADTGATLLVIANGMRLLRNNAPISLVQQPKQAIEAASCCSTHTACCGTQMER